MIALSRAFRGISIAWAGALPLATLAASHPHSSSLIYLFTVVVYGTGSVVCHQLPERSFHLWGAQLPVCARCAGIYAGAAVAAAIAAAFGSTTRPYGARVGLAAKLRLKPPSERPARGAPSLRGFFHSPAARGLEIPRGPREHLLHPLRVLPWRFLVVALPTIATLLYEWTSGVTPSNWIRASAGACLGAAVGTLIVASTTSPAGPLCDVLFWKRASTAPAARASATPERGERGRGPREQ